MLVSTGTKQCNLWVPAMVLALEDLSCSKVASLPHSSVVMNLKVIPCNWVCFVPVDTSTLQVDQSCTSCGITSKKLTGEGECGGDMTGEGGT